MSLESALADHAAALNRNSGLLEQVIAGQSKALEAIHNAEGGKAISGRPRSVKPKEDKPAIGEPAEAKTVEQPTVVKPEAPKPEAPKPEVKPAAAPKSDVLTEEQNQNLRTLIGDWLVATKDQAERGKRHAIVKAILTKYGVQKAPEISPADYDTVVAEIKTAIQEYESASGAEEEENLLG